MDEQTTETQKPKRRGRPRKEGDTILYRCGGRVKAWSTQAGCSVNMPRVLDAAKIYDGLGYDWAVWKNPFTRDGFYNAANRNPFRPRQPVTAEDRAEVAKGYAAGGRIAEVLATLAELFEGRPQSRPMVLEGAFWMRFLANVFIREAGEDGISRSRFAKPEGKLWASVNVLPTVGSGYNYTQEAWFAVVNMIRPPAFCVRISGDEYLCSGEEHVGRTWTPERLANAVLADLWAVKGIDSCAADYEAPKSEPERPALAPEATETCEDTPPDAACDSEAVSERKAEPSSEADEEPAEKPTPVGKTWGEIKRKEVWLKGLTSSKELQAPAPLAKVLETIVSHPTTEALTAECRAIADKKARNDFKRDNLHVWYPSPVFAERTVGSVKGNIVGYTGLACLDFDGLPSYEAAQDARDDIFMQFPEVLFSAVSASGLGVYALVALDFDGTETGYRTALSAAFEMFEAKGYMPDTGCIDPTRARYLSSDADALSRSDAHVPKAVSAEGRGYFILPASMLRTCWTNSGRKRKGAGKAYLDEALARIENAGDGMKDSTITSVMGTVARLIRNYGLDAEKTYNKVREVAARCGYDTRKTEDKIRRLGVSSEGGVTE